MIDGADIKCLETWAGIAGDHLGAMASRISKMSDMEFAALLRELATRKQSNATAMISSLCLHESMVRFLKLTPPQETDA